MVIPQVSPLRGAQGEGTLTIAIGGPPQPRVASPGPSPSVTLASDGPPPADAPAPIDLPSGPAEPLSGASEPAAFDGLAPDGRDEPALPDEARVAVLTAATASTTPLEAGPNQVLHIRFGTAPDEQVVAAFSDLKTIIKSRPGSTPLVLHIPAGAGRSQEMRLGVGVAYDAEFVAEISRRFGDLLQLQLA